MLARAPRPPSSSALLALLALQGCALDFDRYVTGAADASAPTDTGSPPTDTGTPTMDTGTPTMDTGTPTDTGTPPRDTGTPPTDTGTPCPLPWLAATVENLDGSSGGGRVVRVSLPTGTRCDDLGAGVLSAQPLALTQLPSGEIAVATRNELALFDRATGAFVSSVPWGEDKLPLDAWPMQFEGQSVVAVAMRWSGSAGDEVGEVKVTNGRTILATWSRSQFPISIRSMTAHPTQPSQYLGLRSEGRTLAITPTASGAHTTAEIATERNGLTSLQTLVTPSARQVAWTWFLSGQAPRAQLANPSATATTLAYAYSRLLLCGTPACTNFLRAVPDPRTDDAAFAVCEVAGSGLTRHLVAVGPSTGCMVLDGSTLGARARLSHLTVITR